MHVTARMAVAALIGLLLGGALSAAAQDYPARPPAVDHRSMGPIATVGSARIGADQVFELWSPIWYETLAKVRNGKMTASEGDGKLASEWRRVIMSLIKDEVLYQEAEREHNSMINSVVDNMVRQGAAQPRNQISVEIRRLVQQDIERGFRQYNNQMLREAGGAVKLHKVLEGRGLTFQDWQSRLRKKAFTDSYLHQILKPRVPDPGPRQVQEYYSRHPDEFALPGLVRFRHIFFSNAIRGAEAARDAAVEAWERIEDGEISFDAAVREYSDDPETKARGGLETGEEAKDPVREAWLVDIRASLKEEQPGVVAPILESAFGCHVAELIGIGAPRRVPFDRARLDIERKLQNDIWEAETDRHFHTIQKNADIKVIMRSFPPHLSCSAVTNLNVRAPNVYQLNKPNIEMRSRK